MKKVYLPLLSLLLSMQASATLLAPEGRGPKIEQLNLSSSVTATVEGESIKLASLGAGLRSKKVVFVNVKVYIGQLFVSSPESFKKTETDALNSLKEQKAVAVQLHFLRDVDAENLQKSFKDAFKANKVDLSDASITQFLDLVTKGGEAKESKALSILGTTLKDGSEVIAYESTSGVSSEVKGSKGFIQKVFSIWLGTPADDGVAALKKSILKN